MFPWAAKLNRTNRKLCNVHTGGGRNYKNGNAWTIQNQDNNLLPNVHRRKRPYPPSKPTSKSHENVPWDQEADQLLPQNTKTDVTTKRNQGRGEGKIAMCKCTETPVPAGASGLGFRGISLKISNRLRRKNCPSQPNSKQSEVLPISWKVSSFRNKFNKLRFSSKSWKDIKKITILDIHFY